MLDSMRTASSSTANIVLKYEEGRQDEGQGGRGRMNVPINPENLLNVLGILTLGLTSIKTPFAV
jgi:hypothetical protein